ncbi:MAG: ATP-binding cassette domain-containing protein [Bifidobacteriaceae bacterium]|jgi:ABC-type lipoprotein export system ATPase subunit|nr:ATP-binding cassette domain-containing protein [Bifidobacteriaceae bacterium]
MHLTCRDLVVRFRPDVELFRGLSFDLTQGDLVSLTGPSGSGKSTLLEVLAGWRAPTAGTVSRNGVVTVAWVFQSPVGVARRSALDHVALPFLVQGTRRPGADARAAELLDRFGLAAVADRPFGALSGGEAQRLMFTRAVAKGADLLLVDEPTAQLDPASAATVNRVLGELAGTRSIVVVASHDLATQAACDRTIDVRGVPAGVAT